MNRRHLIACGIIVLVAAMLPTCRRAEDLPTGDRQESEPASALKPAKDAATEVTTPTREITVRVQVYDDTQSKPLHDKAEIWFRGHGSWWLKPDTQFGGAAKNLGRRKVGQKDTIALYADGRDGEETLIPFTMTAEMNPNGSARDSIIITIGDGEIEIVGLPVKAATGNTTIRVKRDG